MPCGLASAGCQDVPKCLYQSLVPASVLPAATNPNDLPFLWPFIYQSEVFNLILQSYNPIYGIHNSIEIISQLLSVFFTPSMECPQFHGRHGPPDECHDVSKLHGFHATEVAFRDGAELAHLAEPNRSLDEPGGHRWKLKHQGWENLKTMGKHGCQPEIVRKMSDFKRLLAWFEGNIDRKPLFRSIVVGIPVSIFPSPNSGNRGNSASHQIHILFVVKSDYIIIVLPWQNSDSSLSQFCWGWFSGLSCVLHSRYSSLG